MHTYRQTQKAIGDLSALWTVGFEHHDDTIGNDFRPMRDFNNEDAAAAWTSFLNGGEHPTKPWPTAGI